MKLDQTMLGVMKDLEATVIDFWRSHREMTDHSVRRVYEAALADCDAESRGRRPRPHALTGLDEALYQRVRAVVLYRLGRGERPVMATADVAPQPLEMLVRSLKELGKSVAGNTERGGRQGYLTYVEQFLPVRSS